MLCPTLFSVENEIMSSHRLCYIYFHAECDGNKEQKLCESDIIMKVVL